MAEHRVYDHTNDERPARRRRQVADWGVGEELFDRMPGGRFAREPDIPRGGAADGRRTIVIGDEDELPPLEPAVDERDEFASRDEALRARREHDAVWDGDEPFVGRRDGVVDRGDAEVVDRGGEPFVDHGDDHFVDRGGEHFVDHGDDHFVDRGDDHVVAGRRTIKIDGRPGERAALRPARRRPPRTVSERVGARPDRVAAWAFALGLLLIAVAILTAQL